MTACTVCDRTTTDPTATLCRRCTRQISDALRDIAAPTSTTKRSSPFDYSATLQDDLEALATGQTAIATSSAPTNATTQPPQRDQYRTLRAWRQAYDHWATTTDQQAGELPLERGTRLATELRHELVTTAHRLGLNPTDTASSAAIATALQQHTDQIAHHADARDIHRGITRAVTRTQQAIDRPAERTPVGWCYANDATCGQVLEAEPGDTVVTCRTCGRHYEVHQLRTWALEALRDYNLTAVDISRAFDHFNNPTSVTPERIRQWAARGRLILRGRERPPRSWPLYRVGDVMQLVDEHDRRHANA